MYSCKEKAYAKVNLTLDILGVKDGYHQLDSLAVALDLYDLIAVKKRNDGKIRLYSYGEGSEYIPEEENNAYKAAVAFQSGFSCGGAEISVYKNIPVGAGLGGSSADAAGVLRAMKKLFRIAPAPENERKILAIADETGSDVRAMYTGGACRMRGRGECVTSIFSDYGKERGKDDFCKTDGGQAQAGRFGAGETGENVKRTYFLLICPRTGVSTRDCFRVYDERKETYAPATDEAVRRYVCGDIEGLGKAIKNDLQSAACALNSDVKTALEEAAAFSPPGYGMTGSGSAAFAMFDSREMLDWAKSRYHGAFRAIAAESVVPKKKTLFSAFTLHK
ncbi:MAG: hypothetical protein SPH68_05640 [Candidatus Borkfalkiaceae bacterium]|nr:hypothetical protein [Clostridia bacterium]MDY6223622.1 hypothetical protein [Christensenellaceae bacterium]